MRTSVTGLLLSLLAVIDILVLWTDMFRQYMSRIHGMDFRKLSNGACKFHRFFIFSNGMLGSWIIVIMSLERFFAIYFPIQAKQHSSRFRAVLAVVFCALFCAFFNLHFFWTYHVIERSYGMSCTGVRDKYGTFLKYQWPWMTLVSFSILPFIILISTNVAIIGKLIYSSYRKKVSMGKDKKSDGTKLTSITMTLLSVCFMFILTTGPVVIYRWDFCLHLTW